MPNCRSVVRKAASVTFFVKKVLSVNDLFSLYILRKLHTNCSTKMHKIEENFTGKFFTLV